MRQFFLIILFSFLALVEIHAQIGQWIKTQTKENKMEIGFSFESRNSFLLEQPNKLNGFRLHFEFGEYYNAGIGYYDNGFLQKSKTNLSFIGVFQEFLLFRNKKGAGNLSMMMDFGDYAPTENLDPKAFVAYEVMLGGQLNFLKYFFGGAAVGYRLGLINPHRADYKVSSPLYQLKVGLHFSEIARSLKK
jgi:hypothetical protein